MRGSDIPTLVSSRTTTPLSKKRLTSACRPFSTSSACPLHQPLSRSSYSLVTRTATTSKFLAVSRKSISSSMRHSLRPFLKDRLTWFVKSVRMMHLSTRMKSGTFRTTRRSRRRSRLQLESTLKCLSQRTPPRNKSGRSDSASSSSGSTSWWSPSLMSMAVQAF